MAEPAARAKADNGDPTPADPIMIHIDIEPITEGFIEIVDVKSGHRVISAIEVLSPSNKRSGDGQTLYLDKRNDMKRAGVNTVEIDLLRGGAGCSWCHPIRFHQTFVQSIKCASGEPRGPTRLPSTRRRCASGSL